MSSKKMIMAKVWQRWTAQLFKNLQYQSAFPEKIYDTNKISTQLPKGLQMK